MTRAEAREMPQVIRRNVLVSVHLLASHEEQLEYQRDVPIAHVTAELFCLWDESFQKKDTEDSWYRKAFSKEEIKALQTLDAVVEDVLARTPGILPSIEDWILSPQSKQLLQAAQTALLVFEPHQP